MTLALTRLREILSEAAKDVSGGERQGHPHWAALPRGNGDKCSLNGEVRQTCLDWRSPGLVLVKGLVCTVEDGKGGRNRVPGAPPAVGTARRTRASAAQPVPRRVEDNPDTGRFTQPAKTISRYWRRAVAHGSVVPCPGFRPTLNLPRCLMQATEILRVSSPILFWRRGRTAESAAPRRHQAATEAAVEGSTRNRRA